ncbi:MAG: acetylxylan esterase [Pirellulaceae bacterium]|nr:acetylxylan esterase [Pirellulaceae bacterium]
MQRWSLCVFVWCCASSLACAQATKSAPTSIQLKAVTDRADAIYKVGETVVFTIEATTEAAGDAASTASVPEGNVVCVLSEDGFKPSASQTVTLTKGKATLTGALAKPGFLMLKATMGKATALAAAAVDPTAIQPSMPIPDDFDDFWSAQKSALAAVPRKSQLTAVKSPVAGVVVHDVQVDCLGAPVSGYLGRPENAKPKSLPAILFVHGAGVGSSSLGSANWATHGNGMLTLDINAHGLPNGRPAEFYKQLADGELKDYRSRGRTNRDDVYFKGMFLRLVRAIDFLTSQPEWNGQHLIVYGSSQGGYQALVAAGLDQRVTFICAGVPAGCDHTGSQVDRISGWPKLVATDAAGQPDAASLQAARYFAAVNFARRAKCQGAAVTVGFIDTTCPPTSVYAAFNALGMPKRMHSDPLAGHTNTPDASKFMQSAAHEHAQIGK